MGENYASTCGRQLPLPRLHSLGRRREGDCSTELVTALASSVSHPFRLRPEASYRDHTPASSSCSTVSSTFVSPDRYPSSVSSVSLESDTESAPALDQHQNPRRSSAAANFTPPAFRRGDEPHKNFIEGLLVVTTSILETIWPLSRETPRSSTDFNGGGVLPLRTFIQETCRRSRTSYSTLQIALYYLILLKGVLPALDFTREQPRESDAADNVSRDPQILLGQPTGPSGCRVMQCGRRMFMSALMLAAKYLQDRNFSVKAWSKISGLSCAEINKNEKAYLQSIEYRLHLKKEYFDNWSQVVLELCNAEKAKAKLDYVRLIQCLNVEIIHDSDKTALFLKSLREGSFTSCSPPDWRRDACQGEYSVLSVSDTRSRPQEEATLSGFERTKPARTPAATDGQMSVASLSRCPPPHQSYSNISMMFREREDYVSPPSSSSIRSTTSSSSSPESVPESIFSDNVESSSRTRSSSFSSTSSIDPLQTLRNDAKATHQSPLGRSCVFAARAAEAPRSLPSDRTSHLNVTPRRCLQSSIACVKRKSDSMSLPAAETLVILSRSRGEQHLLGPAAAEEQMLSAKKIPRRRGKDAATRTPKPGHTSEVVKARRKLQRETSRLVKSGCAYPDAVPDDYEQYGAYVPEDEKEGVSSRGSEDERSLLEQKEHQRGCKPWSGSKKPVPVSQNNSNKRLAADVAAETLLWEMKARMCTAR